MEDQLSTVIDDAVAAQPAVSDTGAGIRQELQALTPPAQPTVDGAAQRVSRKGETWDATVHASPPTETARGTWRKIGRGATPTGELSADRFALAARDTCAMAFDTAAPMLNMMLPLEAPADWTAEDAERDNIERALTRFYERYPEYCVDLPPGLALAAAVAGYMLPRLMALPQAQQLISKLLKRGQPEVRIAA